MTKNESTSAIEAMNLNALLKGVPPGAWVAVSHDRTKLLAYAEEMRDALAKAREQGDRHPIVFRTPQDHVALVL